MNGVAVAPEVVAFTFNDDGSMTLHLSTETEVVLPRAEFAVSDMLQAIFSAHRRRANAITEDAHGKARVVEIPHAEIDMKIAVTPDITLEEAAQAMRQLQSPTSVTMPLEIPPTVKTVGDFFGEHMAESIAQQLADEIYGVDCSRCGKATKKPIEVGARKLCTECAALEY